MKTIKIFMILCVTAIFAASNVYAQEMKKEIILGWETSLLVSSDY